MSDDWSDRIYTNGASVVVLGSDQAQGSEDPARIRGTGRWMFWDEVDDTPWRAGQAAYARCAEECRERAAGEPECTDTCRRADAARREA